jgi:hypothetical protein
MMDEDRKEPDENVEQPPESTQEVQPAGVTPEEKEPKAPIWLTVVLSIWIIATFVAFYYFLLAHRVVSYVVER